MKYGLTENQSDAISQCFARVPEVQKVILFGSRAMGNHKPASDIDLLVCGPGVTDRILTRLFGRLNNEAPVPFQFDLLSANDAIPAPLKQHIDQYGVVFFQR